MKNWQDFEVPSSPPPPFHISSSPSAPRPVPPCSHVTVVPWPRQRWRGRPPWRGHPHGCWALQPWKPLKHHGAVELRVQRVWKAPGRPGRCFFGLIGWLIGWLVEVWVGLFFWDWFGLVAGECFFWRRPLTLKVLRLVQLERSWGRDEIYVHAK